MALPIIGADERLAQRKGIKGVIFGRSGIGKTSLLWTLNASTTLFLDLEAGDLAVEGLEIDTLRPRTHKINPHHSRPQTCPNHHHGPPAHLTPSHTLRARRTRRTCGGPLN